MLAFSPARIYERIFSRTCSDSSEVASCPESQSLFGDAATLEQKRTHTPRPGAAQKSRRRRHDGRIHTLSPGRPGRAGRIPTRRQGMQPATGGLFAEGVLPRCGGKAHVSNPRTWHRAAGYDCPKGEGTRGGRLEAPGAAGLRPCVSDRPRVCTLSPSSHRRCATTLT